MLRFNNGGHNSTPGELFFEWAPTATLDEALSATFPAFQPKRYGLDINRLPHPGNVVNAVLRGEVRKLDDPPEPERDRIFSSLFNLRDMNYLADFVVQPTDNILQHLFIEKFRNREYRVTVFIFPHASLLAHLRDPQHGYVFLYLLPCKYLGRKRVLTSSHLLQRSS